MEQYFYSPKKQAFCLDGLRVIRAEKYQFFSTCEDAIKNHDGIKRKLVAADVIWRNKVFKTETITESELEKHMTSNRRIPFEYFCKLSYKKSRKTANLPFCPASSKAEYKKFQDFVADELRNHSAKIYGQQNKREISVKKAKGLIKKLEIGFCYTYGRTAYCVAYPDGRFKIFSGFKVTKINADGTTQSA